MRREEEWKGEGEEDEEGSTEDGEGEGEDMDCEVEKEMGRTRFLTPHNTTKRYCPARAARGYKRAALANEGKGPLAGVGGRNRTDGQVWSRGPMPRRQPEERIDRSRIDRGGPIPTLSPHSPNAVTSPTADSKSTFKSLSQSIAPWGLAAQSPDARRRRTAGSVSPPLLSGSAGF